MKKMIAEKRVLKSLLDISGFINFVENPDLILSLIIEECVLLTRAEWGAVLSYDGNLDLDAFQITKVLSDEEKAHIAAILNEKVKEAIEKNGRDEILDESLWEEKDTQDTFKEALDKKIKRILLYPLKKKETFLGLAIVADKKTKGSFTKKDKENFSILCQEAAIVIENINLIKIKLQNERMAAIGQTMAGISHYIKNILQGISTGSYLLDAGIKDNDIDSIKEAWDVVHKNSNRISDLVMDMLYFSKERKLEKEKIDPKVLIEDVLELVRSKMEEKNIKLELSVKELPPSVMASEKGLHRSILNIIGNAIDACDKPGSIIKLETKFDKPSQNFRIIICDNGKGMSEEDLDRVFQLFYTSKKGKGTGLGLAVTKKLIEEHGGSIKIESELGAGTTFEISIPA